MKRAALRFMCWFNETSCATRGDYRGALYWAQRGTTYTRRHPCGDLPDPSL